MLIAATLAGAVIAGMSLLLGAAALQFARRARQPLPAAAWSTPPRCAVLLAVRGADAYLEDCLRALCMQDHPDYTVHVTVDSETDPGWAVVQRVLGTPSGARRIRATTLRHRLPACSLKCSALLQMTAELEKDVAIVAIIDGDVVPHVSWLRDLSAPLADRNLGATFGIPWHSPVGRGLGSPLCSHWWSIAGMLMAHRGWPWGGSTALRLDTLRRCGIEQRWRTSLSSDTPLHGALASIGLAAQWVPSAVLLSREDLVIRRFLPQLVRYIVVRRLYLPQWGRARTGGITLGAALLTAVLSLGMGLWSRDFGTATISAGALLIHAFTGTVVIAGVGTLACRTLRGNGMPVPRLTTVTLLRSVAALLLLFPVLAAASVMAQHTRHVTWRGVRYSVQGGSLRPVHASFPATDD